MGCVVKPPSNYLDHKTYHDNGNISVEFVFEDGKCIFKHYYESGTMETVSQVRCNECKRTTHSPYKTSPLRFSEDLIGLIYRYL